MGLRVLVAGGRHFTDYPALRTALDTLLVNRPPDVELLTAGGRGVPMLAAATEITRLLLTSRLSVPIAGMDDEKAFQAALDANPDDHTTRLVFADWLEEREDARAEGYRALGANRLRPRFFLNQFKWYDAKNQPGAIDADSDLPSDWFHATRKSKMQLGADPVSAGFETRGQAEDAAALAFCKLPPERRAELLAGEGAAPKRKPKKKPKGKK